ncbi:MAG: pyrroline-5-carboxylate reductase [Gammaproteobacteria bacterium RIFCSPHIGHO2_12_FULL_35_23]|nr:MAG: pyrroline-5-carboxylate reductase [Gammaproteobacteria bacterium RIFCSPHIGHO2_12_FULL_35_23]
MNIKKLAFIGGGNIAYSLVSGLIKNHYPAEKIWVSNPSREKRDRFQQSFSVNIETSNIQAIAQAEVVIFCIKPQMVNKVLAEVAETLKNTKALVISVMAGVRIATFIKWLGRELPLIRAMPNTPAVLGCGITGLYAEEKVSDEEKGIAENIMRSVGAILWLDQEEKMNAVTALAGSGPAYFFLMIEALQQAGLKIGLSVEEAKILVLQTALGAARMALESNKAAEVLRYEVTSPKGTTEQAINCLLQDNFKGLLEKAIMAANNRAKELADSYS